MDSTEPETIRAKQRARRNGTLAILGPVLTAAISLIAETVQVGKVEAEKLQAIESSSHLEAKLDSLSMQMNQLSQRLTAVEVKLDERTKR
jgi:hypothetical protein